MLSIARCASRQERGILSIHPAAPVQVMAQMKSARELPALREHAAQLSRMCAAVRASLETHVR
jgi:hypothetical protein